MSYSATSVSNCNSTTNGTNDGATDFVFRVTFGIIALLAVLGNALVCAVILRNRKVSRNSYNIMILGLAIVDALTGKLYSDISRDLKRHLYGEYNILNNAENTHNDRTLKTEIIPCYHLEFGEHKMYDKTI